MRKAGMVEDAPLGFYVTDVRAMAASYAEYRQGLAGLPGQGSIVAADDSVIGSYLVGAGTKSNEAVIPFQAFSKIPRGAFRLTTAENVMAGTSRFRPTISLRTVGAGGDAAACANLGFAVVLVGSDVFFQYYAHQQYMKYSVIPREIGAAEERSRIANAKWGQVREFSAAQGQRDSDRPDLIKMYQSMYSQLLNRYHHSTLTEKEANATLSTLKYYQRRIQTLQSEQHLQSKQNQ